MIRLLLLWLLLAPPALAQVEGTVLRLTPQQAELSGGQLVPLDHHSYRKLAEHGLGARWKLFMRGTELDSALYLGMAEGVPQALQTLARFLAAIDASRWQEARQLLSHSAPQLSPAEFEEHWRAHWLSLDPADWTLAEPQPGHIEVTVAGSRSRSSRSTTRYRPAGEQMRLTLVHEQGGWRVSFLPSRP